MDRSDESKHLDIEEVLDSLLWCLLLDQRRLGSVGQAKLFANTVAPVSSKKIFEARFSSIGSSELLRLGVQLRIGESDSRSLHINHHFLLFTFLIGEVTEQMAQEKMSVLAVLEATKEFHKTQN